MSRKLLFPCSDSDSEWDINNYYVNDENDVFLLMKFVGFKSLKTSFNRE